MGIDVVTFPTTPRQQKAASSNSSSVQRNCKQTLIYVVIAVLAVGQLLYGLLSAQMFCESKASLESTKYTYSIKKDTPSEIIIIMKNLTHPHTPVHKDAPSEIIINADSLPAEVTEAIDTLKRRNDLLRKTLNEKDEELKTFLKTTLNEKYNKIDNELIVNAAATEKEGAADESKDIKLGEKILVIPSSCEKSTSCGTIILHGTRCVDSSPEQFKGEFICYDSTGCDFGHQVNTIALLKKSFGEKFRVLDPMIYSDSRKKDRGGDVYIHEIRYDTFLSEDNVIIPREFMHSQCSRIESGSDAEHTQLSFANEQPWFLSSVLTPFLEKSVVSTCPSLRVVPDAVVVYNTQIQALEGGGEMDNLIQTHHCNALKENFNGKTMSILTDGPTITCDGITATEFSSLDSNNVYQSSAHKVMCKLKYFAQYTNQFANMNRNFQQIIFAEMLRIGNQQRVYDVGSSSWVEPRTKENTPCHRATGCGSMTLPGFFCDPFEKFSGEFICHDSSSTGCGLGHQINAIATLLKHFGDKFRVLDPIISGDHPEYNNFSYKTFMKDDLLIPRETMFTQCAKIDNGYDMEVSTQGEMGQPWYVSGTLMPFIENHFLACPSLPVLPDAMAVKIRSTDHYSTEEELQAAIQKYCDALTTNFNISNVLVMTDGPRLACEGLNITFIESLESPDMYKSSAQKLMCNLQHIAHYPQQLTFAESNLQQFIYAEMLRIGNNAPIFDVQTHSWVTPPTRISKPEE